MELERRTFEIKELRAGMGTDNKPAITGYAAVFGVRSNVVWDFFRETILPGAFTESLQRDDVRALWQHDVAQVLGRKSAGTLTLTEDEHGLAIEIFPPDTQVGRDAVELIKRGDVSEMSFGFSVPPQGDDWSEDTDGTILRILRKVKLWEVSPVTFPAYPQTEVGMRSLWGEKPELPAALRGATDGAGEDMQRALLRLDVMRRRLAMASV